MNRIFPADPSLQTAKDSRIDGSEPRGEDSRRLDPRTEGQRDRDRILYSAAFRRLGAVTQVVTPLDVAPSMHNRLTHSIKVAQVARSIANLLIQDESKRSLIAKLGGLDVDVCEAAALAHDIGHPPFGHVGEKILDELARDRLDLRDGFEGNAQTMRIITTGEQRKAGTQGLALTWGTIAAVAKYPWTRTLSPEHMWNKFSYYSVQHDLIAKSREFSAELEQNTQSLEASIMDLADDIAYAIHDLEDFFRAGIVNSSYVIDLIDQYLNSVLSASGVDNALLDSNQGGDGVLVQSGASLCSTGHGAEGALWLIEKLKNDLAIKYPGRYNDGIFNEELGNVSRDLSLFSRSSLGAPGVADANRAGMSSDWVGRCVSADAILLGPEPLWNYGPHISLQPEVWHWVQIMKWVTKQFVISHHDVALQQHGQETIMSDLVNLLVEWLEKDPKRLPPRLSHEVEIVKGQEQGYIPKGYSPSEQAPRDKKNRVILDYLCSLSDAQCVSLHARLTGRVIHSGLVREYF